jgi:hypothetical protein
LISKLQSVFVLGEVPHPGHLEPDDILLILYNIAVEQDSAWVKVITWLALLYFQCGGKKMHYHKLLLDELRFVVYEKGDASLTEELLTKAVTVNENLGSTGDGSVC